MAFQRAERQCARQQLVCQNAKGEDIGRGKHGGSASGSVHLFWWHIGVSTKNLIRLSEDITLSHSMGSVSCNAEVRESRFPVLLEEHIFRLQVAMNYSERVNIGYGMLQFVRLSTHR